MSEPALPSNAAIGIAAIAAYLPRRRLSRACIADANSWANPGLKARAKGHRATCSHDEDSLTMAVAAARPVIDSVGSASAPGSLVFASTTAPFADRQNATLIGEALSLPESISSADVGGSLRCASSALIQAMQRSESTLLLASDQRKAQPASAAEMINGDGATALLTGQEDLLAIFLASHSVSIDLTDHYRSQQNSFDYQLEERWVRDEGYLKIIPDAIQALLNRQGLSGDCIDHLLVAGPDQRSIARIARRCGISEDAAHSNLRNDCGDTGSAHLLLMLAYALEQSRPGDKLLLANFSQGCDVLLFEATERVLELVEQQPVSTMLTSGVEDSNYQRYLSFNGLVELDWGMRAERDNRTAHSAFYRHRKSVSGFIGGRCQVCNTPQFPRKPFCTNPECRHLDTQIDEPFKDKAAAVKSYTEDWLALSYNPPLMYGNVRFEGGGVVMMEFADFQPGEINVGTPLSMSLRIKEQDTKRGFKRYFWKATPA
ncbi:3-oxoacyl-[acyl-carrier-protein] synthase III C-terminal domain-containing protein [Spongiibacter marinus]|uniref:3-oxoacyl-[acyl-carrier-protein] synthase III C-terminal domain-containing protein n=1 Tax=Spongiibacter marinus TaxID=354246 RepID=UPI0035BE68B5